MKRHILLVVFMVAGPLASGQANQVVKTYPALFGGHAFFPPAASFSAGISRYIVVADVEENGTDTLRYALLATDGTVIASPSGTTINAMMREHPSVASNGDGFMIAWPDTRSGNAEPYVARISATGALLDSSGIALPNIAGMEGYVTGHPSIASDGTNYLVVWSSGYSNYRIWGIRVNSSGQPLESAPFTIATTHNYQISPVMVVYSGAEFFVVYDDPLPGNPNPQYEYQDIIYGARVTVGGSVAASGIQLVAEGQFENHNVAVAASSSNLVLLYTLDSNGAANKAIRLTFAGVAVDTIPITLNKFAIDTVAFDGANFLLFGYGSDSSGPIGYYMPPGGEIQYSYNGFSLIGSDYARASASQGGGVTLGVNSSGSYILVTSKGDAALCSTADACASGFCVDGVCCATECSGGATDCQACSAAAGNTASPGTCGPIRAGVTCRALASLCDLAETCDGSNAACPADQFAPSSVECRPSTGQCDPAEHCTGSGGGCPTNVLVGPETVCRQSRAACDPAETCTGTSASCPSDVNLCNLPDAGVPDAQLPDASPDAAPSVIDATVLLVTDADTTTAPDANISPGPPDAAIRLGDPDASMLPNGTVDAAVTQDVLAPGGAAVDKVSIIGCAIVADGRDAGSTALLGGLFSLMALLTWTRRTTRRTRLGNSRRCF